MAEEDSRKAETAERMADVFGSVDAVSKVAADASLPAAEGQPVSGEAGEGTGDTLSPDLSLGALGQEGATAEAGASTEATTDQISGGHLRWTFAVILAPAEEGVVIPHVHTSRDFDFLQFVIHTVKKLHRNGLAVKLVHSTRTSQHKVVLLVRCPEKKFQDEFRKLSIRRWKATGQGLVLERQNDSRRLQEVLNPTEADRIQLTALILERSQERGGCDFGNTEHLEEDPNHDPRIVAVFPLHNRDWGAEVWHKWRKDISCHSKIKKSCTKCWRRITATPAEPEPGGTAQMAASPAAARLNSANTIHITGICKRTTDDSLTEVFLRMGFEPVGMFLRPHKSAKPWAETWAVVIFSSTEPVEKILAAPNLHIDEKHVTVTRYNPAKLDLLKSKRDLTPKALRAAKKLKEKAEKQIVASIKLVSKRIRSDNADPETEFLGKLNQQYGERFAFHFAFIYFVRSQLSIPAWTMIILLLVNLIISSSGNATIQDMEVDSHRAYLCAMGLIGIGFPAIWAPMMLRKWDNYSHTLASRWGSVGVTELPTISPHYNEHAKVIGCDWRMWLHYLVSFMTIAGSVLTIFCVSVVVMSIEVLIQTTPLCGSWFYDTVWRKYISINDARVDNVTTVFGTFAWPPCYTDYSEDPFTVDLNSNPWYPWRGIMMVLIGITEGILIGVVYTELFTCLAIKLSSLKNAKYWQQHEKTIINYTYPFEAGASMFYFWVLAFVFIPQFVEIAALFADTDEQLMITFNSSDSLANTAPPNFSLPCKSFGDSTCDEWHGICSPGTDIDDCNGWGCLDPSALNYGLPKYGGANATKAFTSSMFSSFDALPVPTTLRCVYNTSLGAVVNATLCATHDDGQCDEPLRCLLNVMRTVPTALATATFEECLDREDGGDPRNLAPATQSAFAASSSFPCKIGSDANDCEPLLRDILSFCQQPSSSGCLSVLQTTHFRPATMSSATPKEVCEYLLPSNNTVCNSFPAVWPSDVVVGTAATVAQLSVLAQQIQCGTRTAIACTQQCHECVACMLPKPAPGPNRTKWMNQTKFCGVGGYKLCDECVTTCSKYANCFSASVRNRASTGPACTRMGRVNDNWCDEDQSTSNCTGKLDTIADRSAAWLCADGEDTLDCSTCNFGCKDPNDSLYVESARKNLKELCASDKVKRGVKLSDMVKIWFFDKRYKNQLSDMVTIPMTLALFIPMIFEYLLPLFCNSWQIANRRDDSLPKKEKRGCCGRCCCHIFRCCRCCVIMFNCFMCDEDAKGKKNKPPAIAMDDEELAEMIRKETGIDIENDCHETMVGTIGREDRPQLAAADEIIIESQRPQLELPNDYRPVCIVALMVSMWTIVMPLAPIIGWVALYSRFKFNFIRMVNFQRRPIPKKPFDRDTTGGYRSWLILQTYMATVVTSALFCWSTGQLEAWWSLFDSDACQPPPLQDMSWKFPQCSENWPKETWTDDGMMTEIMESQISSSNTKCWEAPSPPLPGCPFDAIDPSAYGEDRSGDGLSSYSSYFTPSLSQTMHRFVSFVVLEHLQLIVLYCVILWSLGKDKHSKNQREQKRVNQHALVAETLFPTEATDRTFAIFQSHKLGRQLTQKMKAKAARARQAEAETTPTGRAILAAAAAATSAASAASKVASSVIGTVRTAASAIGSADTTNTDAGKPKRKELSPTREETIQMFEEFALNVSMEPGEQSTEEAHEAARDGPPLLPPRKSPSPSPLQPEPEPELIN